MILTVSPSSFTTYQECPEKYRLSILQRYNPIESDTTKMDRGRLFHELLDMHYTLLSSGVQYGEVVMSVIGNIRERNILDYTPEIVDECMRNYQDYAVYYKDDGWEVEYVENPFTKIIHETDKHKIVLEGVIDLGAKNSNSRFPVDHKTTDKVEKPVSLTNQFMIYCLVTGSFVLVKNEIGFQKSYGPAQRFHRHTLSYPESRIEEYRRELIEDCLELIDRIENNRFNHRLSSCRFCWFRRVCEQTEDAREHILGNFYKKRPEFDIYAEK